MLVFRVMTSQRVLYQEERVTRNDVLMQSRQSYLNCKRSFKSLVLIEQETQLNVYELLNLENSLLKATWSD